MSEPKITAPSPEGQEVSEQVAKLTALQNEYKASIEANNKFMAEMKAKADADHRISLMERAKELGLSAETFTDVSNDAIEVSLKVAKEVQVSELQKREPVNLFGGEGHAQFADGSPEMVDYVAKTFYGFVEPRKV